MAPRGARVLRRAREVKDVWTFTLEMDDGGRLDFAPGQFNSLTVFGVGEVPISISGDPAKEGGLVHTVRDVGVVSKALVQLGVGEPVGVRGPFGIGWPLDQAKGHDLVIISGGLGLVPLRPAIYHLLANRRHYGKIVLLYGARSPDEIIYRQELEEWRRRLDIEIQVTVDHAAADWYGSVGVVPMLVPRATFDPRHTTALVCGPEIMMRYAALALRDAGVDDKSIYLSMERNMKCGIGLCGHCQLGTVFVCRDGPVFRYDQLSALLGIREL